MNLFLSCVTLDAGHNRTKSELRRPYEFHRTLCNAWENPKDARVLFRAEQLEARRVVVIVQSRTLPDWSRLRVPSDYLRGVAGPKPVDLSGLRKGLRLCFRLQCSPSKRIGTHDSEDRGKRRGLTARADVLGWLLRKAEANGFAVCEAVFDRVYWYDSKGGMKDKRLGAVVFQGILTVTDPGKFRTALTCGIGPAKAFGFGLLSIAPAPAGAA